MKVLLQGFAGFAAITGAVWLIMDWSHHKTGQQIERILADEAYCTERTLWRCREGGYLVLTPDAPSLMYIARTGELSRFVPSDACRGGRFALGNVSEQLWSYCIIRRHPASYSDHEKREYLRRVARENR